MGGSLRRGCNARRGVFIIHSYLRSKPWMAWLGGLLVATLLTGLIYGPGLAGTLHLDSGKLYHIEQIYREQGAAVTLEDLSFERTYGRVIPQLTFYLNIALDDGVDPYSIKLTNVFIHILNAVLVFFLLVMLLERTRYRERSRQLAAAAALLWLISPVNVSGVLYAVQRMNQLATLFSLCTLMVYMKARSEHARGILSHTWLFLLIASAGMFAFLAYACKENALLIPLFIILIELYLFDELPKWLRTRTGIATTLAVMILLIVLLSWLLPGSSFIDYSERTFTLEERLLTQARILWMYIGQLIIPATSAIGLYQDGIPVSTGVFSPASTAVALAGLACMAILSIRYRGHETACVIAFGIAFYITGHLLESSVLPLELYYEHRNYLPSVGLYLALVITAYLLLRRLPRPAAIGVAVLYVVGICIVAHSKSVTWSDEQEAYRAALARDYLSPRAASGMAQIYLEQGQVALAMTLLDRVIAESPHAALRARLQKLYVQCAIGAAEDERLYAALPEVTGRELAIEISQALSNVVNVYAATGCEAVNVNALILAVESISRELRAQQRPSWHVDYYVGELYAMFDRQRAAQWLEQRFLDGEESAGWVLIELLDRHDNIDVAPATVVALEALGADSR